MKKIFQELEFRTIAEKILNGDKSQNKRETAGVEKEVIEMPEKDSGMRKPEKRTEPATQQGSLFNSQPESGGGYDTGDMKTIKTTGHKYHICDNNRKNF